MYDTEYFTPEEIDVMCATHLLDTRGRVACDLNGHPAPSGYFLSTTDVRKVTCRPCLVAHDDKLAGLLAGNGGAK